MKSPIKLLPFQEEPYPGLIECFRSFYNNPLNNRGLLFVMPAGCGKTYVYIKALVDAQSQGIIPLIDIDNPLKPFRILIVTVAKAVTQTTRVGLKAGLKDFLVTSHPSLAESVGDSLGIYWANTIERGILEHIPVWDQDTKPDIIILDESQKTKNDRALISQVTIAAIKAGILVIEISATPFTRMSETTVTNLALGLIHDPLDNVRFTAQFSPSDYHSYCPTAMERYNDFLVEKGLKLEAHNIKFPHRVFNKCRLIDFESAEHKRLYDDAYEEYCAALINNDKNTPEGIAAIWVAMLKFREKAELIRAGYLARIAHKIITTQGKQVAIATNFIASLELVQHCLMDIHGYKESNISIIRGGTNARNTQKHIDNFQLGRTDICLLTLKSGGAGLSLHHEHDSARARYGLIPPTWSAIELVQLLGRLHRITSRSTTYQDVIWFKNTIEEHVAAKVAIKMRSLQKIVSKKETWVGLFNKEANEDAERMISTKLLEEESEITEDGDNVIDTLPISAFENNGEQDGDNNLIVEM